MKKTNTRNTKLDRMKEKSVLNLEFLQEMSGGYIPFIIEILEIFVEDGPSTFQSINKNLADKDFSSVKTSVHKLKSSLKILGAEKLADLAENLEEETSNKVIANEFYLKLSKLEKSVEQLAKDVDKQVKYLKAQL